VLDRLKQLDLFLAMLFDRFPAVIDNAGAVSFFLNE
jgi:hypothetical protein